ncbi:MAG: hypothetical protein WB492_02850 [Christiangramia sp.]
MRSTLSFLVILTLLLSCKNEKDKEPLLTPETEEKEAVEISEKVECFSYSGEKDTIFMSIHIKDDSIVEGDLVYSLDEKDRNKGSIRGTIHGDSLFADYEFDSEGRSSTREVFFLRTDNGLIEGFAPVKDSQNKTVFTHHNFRMNNKMALTRVDCL